MQVMIDFVSGSGGYLIEYNGVTGEARVGHGTEQDLHELLHRGTLVREFSELESARLPALVLLNLHRQFHPIDRFSTRRKIERKVWKYMETLTAEEQKTAKQALLDQKAVKKEEAEKLKAEKKAAADAKKADAEKAKADKKAAADAKKADADKAKAEKKAAADAKKAETKAAAKKPTAPVATARYLTHVIHKTDAKQPEYRGKRGAAFNVITDGMTVAGYKEAAKEWGAGLDYLRFYESQGLITLEAPAPVEPVITEQQ